jgi:hypothetical protein
LSESLPLFVAVVLDDPAHKSLLSWWEQELGPVLSKTFAHHMTVKFKPTAEEVADFAFLGKPVTLQVVGWAANEHVQAVVVEGHGSANEVSHVTVATDGTPPFKSNELLDQGFTRTRGPALAGTLLGQGKRR